jgi:hypothetical protein
MYSMTPMYPMYKDKHIEKFKRVMRHIKLISIFSSFCFFRPLQAFEVLVQTYPFRQTYVAGCQMNSSIFAHPSHTAFT